MGHSDIRQMAQRAQHCLLYSYCSSKNNHDTKVEPAAAPPLLPGRYVSVDSRDFGVQKRFSIISICKTLQRREA